MQPEILELSGKTVYMIYGNKLLLDVPKKKIEECVEALNSGREYSRKVRVFTIDQNFKLSFDGGTDAITFSDGGGEFKKINYENGNDKVAIVDWLTSYLVDNGFREAKETVSSAKMLMRGVGAIIVVLFIFGLLFVAEGDTDVRRGKGAIFVTIANLLGTNGIIIGGVICLLIAIIYTIRLIKRGDEVTTYSKM